MPNPLNVPITPPRVAFIDPRTGNVSREWYMFFLSLFQSTGGSSVSLDDLQKGPPALTLDEINTLVDTVGENLRPSTESVVEQIAELRKQIQALEVQVRPELGTMSQLQQDNVPWLQFDTTPSGMPTGANANGTLYWDDADGIKTLNLVMEDSGGVVQQIGEETYYRIKADAAITNGQVVMFTGTVGASGALKGAPATGLTAFQNEYIMGVATQDIANNGWGYVTWFGLVRGINTTGGAEAWVDGQILYYNPAVPGGLTKNVPTAPNPKVIVASVVHAASNGSLFVRPTFGSALGSTDSNVEITGLANGDLLQYDSVQQRWENVPASTLPVGTATNLAGGAAGSVPYQSAPSTTAMLSIGAAGRWLGSSGTLPQWNAPAALTKTDDANVTLTLGGSASTALLNAASLTIGWTGQLAATRGGTGFGSYAVGDILYADTTTTLAKLPDVATGNALISGGVGVAPAWGKIGLTTHVTGTLPVGNGGTGTATAFTAGSVVFAGASGVYTQDNTNFFWDDTNNRLGLGNATPACTLDVTGGIQTSRTGVTSPAATDGNVFSGSYTPTLTNTTNITSSTASTLYYTRVGNVVAVFGRVNITATATGNTLLGISLPIASALTTNGQVAGMGALTTATVANNTFGRINADATNDRAQFQLNSTTTTDQTYAINFTYVVL